MGKVARHGIPTWLKLRPVGNIEPGGWSKDAHGAVARVTRMWHADSRIDEPTLQALERSAQTALLRGARRFCQSYGVAFDTGAPQASLAVAGDLPILNRSDELALLVHCLTDGDFRSYLLLLFDEQSALSLWHPIAGSPPRHLIEAEPGALSAFAQAAQTLIDGFVEAWSELLDVQVKTSHPLLCLDMASASLNAVGAQASSAAPVSLVITSTLTSKAPAAQCQMLFLLNSEDLERALNGAGVEGAA
jgi:chemotaxis protein CheY-P-specific phosphatase CheC